MLQIEPAIEPHIGVGPLLLLVLRHALEVEIFAVDRTETRPGMSEIGRALAQHHHGELFFLRAIEADRHVVLRALLGQQHLHHPVEMPLGQEEMMREEALIGGRISEVRIDREQIVQQGRAGAPMADDEDRRLVELEVLGGAPVLGLGDPIQHRVPRHPQKQQQRVGDGVQREREAAAREQLHQSDEAHAEPEIDQPAAIALDGEGRHARLGAASAGGLAFFVRRDDLVIRHAKLASVMNFGSVPACRGERRRREGLRAGPIPHRQCPASCRASTIFLRGAQDADGRVKPGHDEAISTVFDAARRQ